METIKGKNIAPNVIWWGWSQWYKWRWNSTHIDLGPLSVYEIRASWFWKIVAFLIVPLRTMYHLFFVHRKQVRHDVL